jgi:hypothetical protein
MAPESSPSVPRVEEDTKEIPRTLRRSSILRLFLGRSESLGIVVVTLGKGSDLEALVLWSMYRRGSTGINVYVFLCGSGAASI